MEFGEWARGYRGGLNKEYFGNYIGRLMVGGGGGGEGYAGGGGGGGRGGGGGGHGHGLSV